MDIAVALAPPVHEFDTELEARLRGLHELDFVEPEEVVEILHLRQCRFADTDGPDLFGFDEADAETCPIELRRARRGAHPAGGPAANDHQFEPIPHIGSA